MESSGPGDVLVRTGSSLDVMLWAFYDIYSYGVIHKYITFV